MHETCAARSRKARSPRLIVAGRWLALRGGMTQTQAQSVPRRGDPDLSPSPQGRQAVRLARVQSWAYLGLSKTPTIRTELGRAREADRSAGIDPAPGHKLSLVPGLRIPWWPRVEHQGKLAA